MGFWGLEVKPGKSQSFDPKNEDGKLHVTQATLGEGFGREKSVIQCSIGDKAPVFLCSLLPNKMECCPLNLEFNDDDGTVEFTVTGNRSIHLSGYLEPYDEEEDEQDEYDSDGIEIGETESEESSDYDSEEDQLDKFEDFLDSNLEMYRRSSAPNSGVVIEEIEDEEKPAKDDKAKRSKKKSQASKDEKANKQIIARETADVPVLESEDEDGFPIPKEEAPEQENKTGEKMDLNSDDQGSNKKRKAKAAEQDGIQESGNKNKKKKNQKEKKKGDNASNVEAGEQVPAGNVLKKQEAQNGTVNSAMSETSKTPVKSAEKKNKKQKKNSVEEATVESKTISGSVEKQKTPEQNQVKSNASQERTYPNGLIVEELRMGRPDGKKAAPGKQVSVRYIGKLQKNGKIFDSNIGKAPFKFRLGVGQVIKGWDVGVTGMRVGDKRKLTIPPSMGYGDRGAGGQIPPNAWLTFDVELIDVR
uniref:FK506-binding protein n=1 Tax=Noccaea caerulescens TaxID=107243 RepID=A0A1J3J128_NOCCA